MFSGYFLMYVLDNLHCSVWTLYFHSLVSERVRGSKIKKFPKSNNSQLPNNICRNCVGLKAEVQILLFIMKSNDIRFVTVHMLIIFTKSPINLIKNGLNSQNNSDVFNSDITTEVSSTLKVRKPSEINLSRSLR